MSSKRCRAIGTASDTLLKNFSLSAHARAQLFSLNFCYQTFFSTTLLSKLFSRKSATSFSATILNLSRKIWLPNEMGAWVGGVFNQQLWMKRSL